MEIGKNGPNSLPSKLNIEALGQYQDRYLTAIENLQEGLDRSLYWTLRLALESEKKFEIFTSVPGFKEIAIGIINPETKLARFGITILASSSISGFPDRRSRFPRFLQVDGYRFPIMIKRITENLHVCNPHSGTGGCWAVSFRLNSNFRKGVLTTKHVVGTTLGVPVKLSCGNIGVVGDIAPNGIDAALISSDCKDARKKVEPKQLLAPWSKVTLHGSSSGAIPTIITQISNPIGILNNSFLPVHVFLADPGRPGDSGALIVEQGTNIPIGLYMGSFTDPGGNSGGIAQHLYQAASIMQLELYV